MAFSFVQYATASGLSDTTSLACNKPTGTSDNDIMLACVVRRGDKTDPSTPPTDWTQLCGQDLIDGGDSRAWIYYRVASSEGSSYTWTWAAPCRTQITIVSYRDFNTSDPIDVYSNTAYTTSNATVRSASMTLSAANTPVINFAVVSDTTSYTFTPPTNFDERADLDPLVRIMTEVSDYVYSSSGSTGDIDATASGTIAGGKHGFAVALNPAVAAGRTTKNTRAFPHGIFRGIRRMMGG